MPFQTRYTDSHLLERDRGISIKSAPLSLVLQNTRGKSYLCNLLDTPGHTNFQDEVAASTRLADGVLLVVDVVEGVMCNTEAIIKHAIVSLVSYALACRRVLTRPFAKMRAVIFTVSKFAHCSSTEQDRPPRA